MRRREARGAPGALWEPFRDLEDMRDRVERLIETLWRAAPEGADDVWAPLVDVEETDEAWVVKAELPGVQPGDVNVEVSEGELRVWGERREEDQREGDVRQRMRRMGRFEYRATIPPGVDPQRVDASLDNGVLTVHIPKPQRSEARQVEVRTAAGGG